MSPRAPRPFKRTAGDGSAQAALTSPAPVDAMDTTVRPSGLDELTTDLRLLAVAFDRSATDSGARHELAAVAAEFGVDLGVTD